MEFNVPQQYRSPAEAFPFAQQRARVHAGPRIFTCGTFPAQPPPPQPTPRVSPQQQPFSTWPFSGNPAQSPHPLQRRSTVMLDTRSQPAEIPQARPLSMTAQAMRSLGIQNPQGEYLPQPKMPQPVVQHPTNSQTTMPPNPWLQPKGCGDFEFASLEPDISDLSQGLLSSDEDTPIIDLRQYTHYDTDHSQDVFSSDASRRMSESSYSMSSNGPIADVSTFEDLASSDVTFHQDYEWAHLEPPTHSLMSPMPSPRPANTHELIRSNSRSRASPVPNLRASPYTLESSRNKRWSTGMYPSQTPPRPQQFNRYSSFYGSPLNPQNAISPFDNASHFHMQDLLYPQAAHLQQGGTTLFSSPDQQFPDVPRPLPSQGLFRLLQSNADRLTGCSSHFADLSDPPDLYSSLHEEPSNPPEEDMNPSDPDMVPHEQDLRFQGDLYTPRWVRGHGNKREGWCGLCKPGRWLVLKNSAFWYDKSFTHGVSAATGAAFQGPQDTRRTEGNLDVWEGLCGSCGDWIALVSSKKKGTTWFRHAYKCHTHPKVKDGPKRRRETNTNIRVRAASVSAPLPSTAEDTSGSQSPVESPSTDRPPLKKVQSEPIVVDIKSENDTTPMSTPQLTHTQLSTPQIPPMHTPNSHQQLTSTQNKRFSVNLDQFSLQSAPFTARLESFSEHTEQPMHDNKDFSFNNKEINSHEKELTFQDNNHMDFLHKEMDFENGKEMSFLDSFNQEINKEMSFEDPIHNSSPAFNNTDSNNSSTFLHQSIHASPSFHNSNDNAHNFRADSDSTFPGNHNPTFQDHSLQTHNDNFISHQSDSFAPNELPHFSSSQNASHEGHDLQFSSNEHANEQFISQGDQYPVLSVESDDMKTTNPFDSFANMI